MALSTPSRLRPIASMKLSRMVCGLLEALNGPEKWAGVESQMINRGTFLVMIDTFLRLLKLRPPSSRYSARRSGTGNVNCTGLASADTRASLRDDGARDRSC
jgi:hypothetical protein